jgi:RNA polymerase sigma-70 factor (ECF subfamily)
LRKQKNNKTQYTEESPEPEPEPFISSRQAREDAGETAAIIAAALDRLPPKCKEVFLLVKLQGMTYKQAAETLGLSVSTIENQMGKAIKLMRTAALISLFLFVLLIKKSSGHRGFLPDLRITIGTLSDE